MAKIPTDKIIAAEAMVKSGVITINEIRKYLGLDPVPHGEQFPILKNT